MSREAEGQREGRKGILRYFILFGAIALAAAGLAFIKTDAIKTAAAAAAATPEPMEVVTAATATAGEYRLSTTSIGTILALESITLRNEMPGTVREVKLVPGSVVNEGDALVALDVSIEQADLDAQKAASALATSTLARLEKLRASGAASSEEVDQARAQQQVAVAQIARLEAIIARKVIRAPFRARVGLADVHPGQYLDGGTELTTLQGVANAANVDFSVTQLVAAALRPGQRVDVFATESSPAIPATIVAIDAKVDPATRNALVRARVAGAALAAAPGASVRVVVPAGPMTPAVMVPISALRKGPAGDHVFVLAADPNGDLRAQTRPVQAGGVVGDEVVIISGLQIGEQVASSGSFKLREGVKVMVDPGQGQGAGQPPAAEQPAAQQTPEGKP
jgi:membrane fusion protein, multidrug efflux system